jgi:glycosyltransferase involved in cell wall biosynthesis
MNIAIDLRCLNYAKYTGINAYCIHILACFQESIVKNQDSKTKLIGIGLKKERLLELQKEFTLFDSLFSSHRTLEEYYKIDLNNTKILELVSVGQIYYRESLDFSDLDYFDYLIQPQPRLIKLNPKTKLITFFHDTYELEDSSFRLNKILNNKKSWKLISNRSQKIITNSRSTSIDLIKCLNSDKNKIKLIYPGTPDLDSIRFIKKDIINKDQKTSILVDELQPDEYILAISGIEPRKNWYNFLLAFKYLQVNHSYTKKLVLAGTVVDKKYYKSLLSIIKKQKIENVVWIIDLNDKDKNTLIQNCSFLVYPSFYEGFGFPILEAQKYKKNILTSKNSSLVEINPGNVFINPIDFISIAKGVVLIGELGFVKSKTVFTWQELQNYIDKLLISC